MFNNLIHCTLSQVFLGNTERITYPNYWQNRHYQSLVIEARRVAEKCHFCQNCQECRLLTHVLLQYFSGGLCLPPSLVWLHRAIIVLSNGNIAYRPHVIKINFAKGLRLYLLNPFIMTQKWFKEGKVLFIFFSQCSKDIESTFHVCTYSHNCNL